MSSLLPAPPQEDADVMYREEVLIDGIQEEETSTDTNNNHENNDIDATALLNHNQTGSIEGVPFAPTFGNVDTQSMIPTSYATAQCSSPFASILHKYRIRSWNDLSRTSVLNSDIQDLVKTAAFVFFPGVHLEISMTNGQKKQYTCAFEGCEWSCSFLKQQGNSRSESLWKFQDSALESERRKKIHSSPHHSMSCLSCQNNHGNLIPLRDIRVLRNLPDFAQIVVQNGKNSSTTLLLEEMEKRGYDLKYFHRNMIGKGKRHIWSIVNNHVSNSYSFLPVFLRSVCEKNRDTICVLQADDRNRFYRLLIVPPHVIKLAAANALLDIIQVDYSHSKTEYYDGVLFTAVMVDGNGKNVVVAWGCAPSESAENTSWFLREIHKGGLDLSTKCILMDRHPSRSLAIRILASEGIYVNVRNCLEHLLRNIRLFVQRMGYNKYDIDYATRIRAILQAMQSAYSMKEFFLHAEGLLYVLKDREKSARLLLYVISIHPLQWTVFANRGSHEQYDTYENYEKAYEFERVKIVFRIFKYEFFQSFQEAAEFWRKECVSDEPRGEPVPMFSMCRTNRVEGTNYQTLHNGMRDLPPPQASEAFLLHSADTTLKMQSTVHKMLQVVTFHQLTTIGTRIAEDSRKRSKQWSLFSCFAVGEQLRMTLSRGIREGQRRLIVIEKDEESGIRLHCKCSYAYHLRSHCPCCHSACDHLEKLFRDGNRLVVDFLQSCNISLDTFEKKTFLHALNHKAYDVGTYIDVLIQLPTSSTIPQLSSIMHENLPDPTFLSPPRYKPARKATRDRRRIRSAGEGSGGVTRAPGKSRTTRTRFTYQAGMVRHIPFTEGIVRDLRRLETLNGVDLMGNIPRASTVECQIERDTITKRVTGNQKKAVHKCSHCGLPHHCTTCKAWLSGIDEQNNVGSVHPGRMIFYHNSQNVNSDSQEEAQQDYVTDNAISISCCERLLANQGEMDSLIPFNPVLVPMEIVHRSQLGEVEQNPPSLDVFNAADGPRSLEDHSAENANVLSTQDEEDMLNVLSNMGETEGNHTEDSHQENTVVTTVTAEGTGSMDVSHASAAVAEEEQRLGSDHQGEKIENTNQTSEDVSPFQNLNIIPTTSSTTTEPKDMGTTSSTEENKEEGSNTYDDATIYSLDEGKAEKKEKAENDIFFHKKRNLRQNREILNLIKRNLQQNREILHLISKKLFYLK